MDVSNKWKNELKNTTLQNVIKELRSDEQKFKNVSQLRCDTFDILHKNKNNI